MQKKIIEENRKVKQQILSAQEFDEKVNVLLELLGEKKEKEVSRHFRKMHPADIAHVLLVLPRSSIEELLLLIEEEGLVAKTLVELPEAFLEEILEDYDAAKLSRMLERVDPDDAADLLELIPEKIHPEIFKRLTAHKAQELKKLLTYEEDSAGALMDPSFIALSEGLTVEEAKNEIRFRKDEIGDLYFLYIVDSKRRLVGFLKIGNLLFYENSQYLKDVMDTRQHFVTVNTSGEEIADLFTRYDLSAIAVTGRDKKLLGRITIDDIVDFIQEENTKDVYQMTSLNENDRVSSSVWSSTKLRIPWLILHFFTAMGAVFVISRFEETLNEIVVLAALMPIVAGMGGNAGCQTLTIIIRGLALGELQSLNRLRAVMKESLVGILTGLFIGVLCGLVVWYWKGSWQLGAVLAIALLCNLALATCVGAVIPLFLKKMNIDPALASTTLLTALTDACGFFIFLSLAQFFISHFNLVVN